MCPSSLAIPSYSTATLALHLNLHADRTGCSTWGSWLRLPRTLKLLKLRSLASFQQAPRKPFRMFCRTGLQASILLRVLATCLIPSGHRFFSGDFGFQGHLTAEPLHRNLEAVDQAPPPPSSTRCAPALTQPLVEETFSLLAAGRILTPPQVLSQGWQGAHWRTECQSLFSPRWRKLAQAGERGREGKGMATGRENQNRALVVLKR